MQPTPRLLTPPREQDIVYPYRRVWRSITIEGILLLLVTVAFYVAVNLLGFTFPSIIRPFINAGLALLPLLFWLVFSYLPERRVDQPRERLLMVLVVTALVANAVGIPLLDRTLQIDNWLSLSSPLDRIIGYAFTVGVLQETLKYVVVRTFTWPYIIRTPLDAVAYGAASAVGYLTVAGLHFSLSGGTTLPSPEVVATRVFSLAALHLSASTLVAYGLAASRFRTGPVIVLPLSLILACLLTGIAIPLRTGLVNAGFTQGVGAPNTLLGLGLSIGIYGAPIIIASFLFSAQSQREREAAASRET
ncbi:MAG: PrsW family glutamic-type intramembrane protease [bacterium]|nr:PrsW family glutamic-type intramembrane protease [bacterium]